MKLTDELLTQLINEDLGRLDEKSINVNLGGINIKRLSTDDKDQRNKIAPDIEQGELEDLSGLINPDALDKRDLAKAYSDSSDKSSEFKAAEKIRTKSKTPALRVAANQIFAKVNPIDYRQVAGADADEQGLSIDDPERLKRLKGAGVSAAKYSDVSTEQSIKDFDGSPLKNIAGVRVDSSVAATVSAIPGESYMDKIASLQKDFDLLASGNASNLTPEETARLANSLIFLQLFGDSLQEYESAAAGTAFESLIALLAKGVVVGGQSGAVDVLAGDSTYMSVKFYNSAQIHQAVGKEGGIGIRGVVQDENKPVVYIVGLKAAQEDTSSAATSGRGNTKGQGGTRFKKGNTAFTAAVSEVKYIQLYAFRVMWLKGKYAVSILKGGTEIKSSDGEIHGKTKLLLNRNINDAVSKQAYFASIPVLPTDGAVLNATQMLNQLVLKSNNKMLKNISNIYKRLQNMNLNTQEYVALKAKKSQNTTEHLKALSADYTNMGEEYKQVTKSFNDTFTEENEKLTQETLDKLIEQVILHRQ